MMPTPNPNLMTFSASTLLTSTLAPQTSTPLPATPRGQKRRLGVEDISGIEDMIEKKIREATSSQQEEIETLKDENVRQQATIDRQGRELADVWEKLREMDRRFETLKQRIGDAILEWDTTDSTL